MSRMIAPALIALCLALGLAFWIWPGGAGSAPPPFQSAQPVPRPIPLAEFALTDHRGGAFTRERLRERFSLLFIGFAHCPDVCPHTLWLLSRLEARLQAAGADVAMVFVSVDPERDTPEALARYVGYFSPHFVGVTGTAAELTRFTSDLGLGYVKIPGPGGGYVVEHSAALVLIDPRARVVAHVRPPLDVEGLARDLLPRIIGTVTLDSP